MIIILSEKPETGRFDRVCKACGDNYYGFNFAICQPCERKGGIRIVHAWPECWV